jgi:hypothetical protein
MQLTIKRQYLTSLHEYQMLVFLSQGGQDGQQRKLDVRKQNKEDDISATVPDQTMHCQKSRTNEGNYETASSKEANIITLAEDKEQK